MSLRALVLLRKHARRIAAYVLGVCSYRLDLVG
jgi:hypothetical protein